jgi:glycosyltransferase involved in cell wall biosynthesis
MERPAPRKPSEDDVRVCLIGATHPCHNPRLVREADALAERGHQVRVVAVQAVPELVGDDEKLVASRRWRLQVASILRSPWPNRLRAIPNRLRRGAAAKEFQRSGECESAEHALCEAAPQLLRLAWSEPADWFIAHTQTVLGVAAKAARRHSARLGFDCEDLLGETGQAAPEMAQAVERAYLPSCDYITVTSRAMQARLQQQYSIAPPTVLYNVFPLASAATLLPPQQRPHNPVLRLHWSGQTAGPGKGLEEAVEAASLAGGGVEICLRGNPAAGFGEGLSRLARERGVPLKFLPHVHHDDLLATMGEFDVGLALERASDSNYSLTVTNKVFSYMLAGLAIAFTDTPGQREVFEQAPGAAFIYPCGRPELLAARLRQWRDDRLALRAAQCASWQAARALFCWEREKPRYLQLIEAPVAPQAHT